MLELFQTAIPFRSTLAAAAFGMLAASSSFAQCTRVTIDDQPESLTVDVTAIAIFELVASGTEEITYQWQQQDLFNLPDFVDIYDGGVYDPFGNYFASSSGTTTNRLELSNFTGVAQVFRCVATNACGRAESSEVTLTFNEPCPSDFNHDSVVDFFDYLDFVQSFSNSLFEADFNFDGEIDFFDYLDFVQAFSSGC